MRLCIVLDAELHGPARGGVEKATHALCMGLLRAGHRVTLIGSGDCAEEDSWNGVPAIRVPQSPRYKLIRGAHEWSEAVVRTLTRLEPDVVQGQGLGFAGSAVIGWRGGARVVAAHGNVEADLRHAYSLPGRVLRAPLVRAHGMKAVRNADAVVNVTGDWRVNCPLEPRATIHIPNPVDDAFFVMQAAPEPGTIAFFGGTRRIKGADLLLRAWPHVLDKSPHASLHLYGFRGGDGTKLPPNCAAHDSLDSSRETAVAMSRASVVVIPSRFEVSPLVAAEAMTIGVPLVAADVGGVRAMTEGVASLCRVSPTDIADHLVRALTSSSELTERVREGRKRSAAFRIDAVTDSYSSLYAALASQGRAETNGHVQKPLTNLTVFRKER